MASCNPIRLKALISTIEPIDGGVPTMTRWICKLLEELDITPVLAWYAPWRNYPNLSIPLHQIISGEKPKVFHKISFEKYESYGIGAWLPELEFTHYLPSKIWKGLIGNCQLHLAVSGNALCALPYFKSKVPFWAWIATPWEADRKDRIREFIIPRRILDTLINTPVLRGFEKRILNSSQAKILCLSNYTSTELNYLAPKRMHPVMYMPVNTDLFRPDYGRIVKWRIGFSGRYCDPRKNIELLLEATQILLNQGNEVELILVGERKADELQPLIKTFGLSNNVICYMHMSPEELAPLLQTFDVFAIPSHQEGLCIAALEAMACGVPVVSTRCGGPEDYVQPGVTGELVDKSANAFALIIKEICMDRKKRHQLSMAAVNWIETNASQEASRQKFREHLSFYAKSRGYSIN
ncbi:MAG: glycosyltransferase family 4 protein [Cyanobacteriota bacterium]|jgi:glycosyltransferase involved in cell wall biosynthesis